MKNVVRARVVQQALLTAALVTALVYPGIAAAVFVQPGTPAIVMTDNRMPLAGVTLTLTPVDGGDPINLTTGPNGEFCDDDDADNKNGQDDDEKRCAFIPDGKYRITGSLDGMVTITDGVPHFSRWTTWNNAAKGGSIAGGAALIGLGLSGGGNGGKSGGGASSESDQPEPEISVTPGTPNIFTDPKVTPGSIQWSHQVTITECPQNIGTLQIFNPNPFPIQVSIQPGSAIRVNGAATRTIPAGGSVFVGLQFDCSETGILNRSIRLVYSADGKQQGTRNIPATGTVQ